MIMLQDILGQLNTNEEPDTWTYIWNSSNFSVKRTYKHLSGHQVVHPAFKWLWASLCQNKHKIFFRADPER